MQATRKPLDGLAVALMLVLCACWGLQQVAIKVAAASIHPILQIGARSAIAALLVCALMVWRGGSFSLRDGTLRPGLLAGALFAAEFLCVAAGLRYTTASHMAVFLYTGPIFTALGLHRFIAGERLRIGQWCGVAFAFAGIALAFSGGFGMRAASRYELLGDSLGVLAGLFWAATTVVIRRTALSEAPPTKTLLYQLAVAAIVLLAIAARWGQWSDTPMTAIAWASLAFQSVVIAFATFLTWFWMLRRYLASRLSVFSFLSPLFGVGFGVLLLNDPVDARFAGGAALVLAGIITVNLRRDS